jgi:hypothetical protein
MYWTTSVQDAPRLAAGGSGCLVEVEKTGIRLCDRQSDLLFVAYR